MIYKIGSTDDMANIVFEDKDAQEVVYHFTSIMTYEYGENRNIDMDDGGYILYATSGTTIEEIKTFFDYTGYEVEFASQQGSICSALYILSSDYAVVIVMSVNDAPPEILKEIDN